MITLMGKWKKDLNSSHKSNSSQTYQKHSPPPNPEKSSFLDFAKCLPRAKLPLVQNYRSMSGRLPISIKIINAYKPSNCPLGTCPINMLAYWWNEVGLCLLICNTTCYGKKWENGGKKARYKTMFKVDFMIKEHIYALLVYVKNISGRIHKGKSITSCVEGDFSLCMILHFLEFEEYKNVPSQILNK